ncbi:hypothetical protein Tco_0431601 [Tanacetum coccineum]
MATNEETYDQPLAMTTTNMFQANHEDAYDSDVDEGPNAAAAFMANLSSTSATNSQVNEVHSNDNQIFDNVDYQLSQEMHQEEHLDSDAETEIDDNTIPYHQYLLDTEAQNVPTEVSADTSDKVSMIAILTDLQTQLDGHAKTGTSPGMYNLGSKYIPPPKRANWVKPTPLPKKRQVTFSVPPKPSLKLTQKPVVHPNKQTNVCVPMSTRVKPTSGASKTVPKRAPRNHSSLPVKSANAMRVEAHHRTLNKKNRVDSNLLVKHSVSVSNLNNVCGACNKSLVFANHTDCLVMCDGSVNVKPHQTKHFKCQPRKEWKPVKRIWKPISKPVANSEPQWKPTGRHFSLFEKNPLTMIMEPTDMPIELPPSASSSPQITMVSRFTDHKLSDRKAGSKGISDILEY